MWKGKEKDQKGQRPMELQKKTERCGAWGDFSRAHTDAALRDLGEGFRKWYLENCEKKQQNSRKMAKAT